MKDVFDKHYWSIVVEPPPIPFEFSDNHEGWKYWLDHVRGY